MSLPFETRTYPSIVWLRLEWWFLLTKSYAQRLPSLIAEFARCVLEYVIDPFSKFLGLPRKHTWTRLNERSWSRIIVWFRFNRHIQAPAVTVRCTWLVATTRWTWRVSVFYWSAIWSVPIGCGAARARSLSVPGLQFWGPAIGSRRSAVAKLTGTPILKSRGWIENEDVSWERLIAS